MPEEGVLSQIKRIVVGQPIPSHQAHHERLSRVTGLAVLSSDPLSSVAYATEEILRRADPGRSRRAELRRSDRAGDCRDSGGRRLLLPADDQAYPGGGSTCTSWPRTTSARRRR